MDPWVTKTEVEAQIAHYRQLDTAIERRLRAASDQVDACINELRNLWGDDLSSLHRDHPKQMIAHYEEMLSGQRQA